MGAKAPEYGGVFMDAPNKEFALAGSLEELKAKGRLVVHGGHRAVHGQLAADVPQAEIVRQVALFGAQNRDGWGVGLTILTALANLLPVLPEEQAYLALFHGAKSRPKPSGRSRIAAIRSTSSTRRSSAST
jgi:hypothetical protein